MQISAFRPCQHSLLFARNLIRAGGLAWDCIAIPEPAGEIAVFAALRTEGRIVRRSGLFADRAGFCVHFLSAHRPACDILAACGRARAAADARLGLRPLSDRLSLVFLSFNHLSIGRFERKGRIRFNPHLFPASLLQFDNPRV